METNLKIPPAGVTPRAVAWSSRSNPRICAPAGNCKCKLRRGNYVFTDLCIREKQTSRAFHIHVDFRLAPFLSRNTVSPCLRFATQTIFRYERYCAITTTTTTKTETTTTTTPLPEKIAFVSIIARTRDMFSEVDRNKPPVCRDANRKCDVGSKERQRTCGNSDTKLHCAFA